MNADRWQQVKILFDRAVERDPASRAEFIRELCGNDEELQREVESLLASDQQAGSLLDNPLVAVAGGDVKGTETVDAAAVCEPARSIDPMIGRTIGPYRVIREIGRGGMGFVYLAQRADDQFRRRVALKVVDPALVNQHTLNRFENERQTLASLDHPNIIKLLDGGTTEDGLPWLVMDYMEGETIERYCKTHSLSIPERLILFRTVCGAVHYAHQNLVIHRDLKPANILITPQGVPKLLDFGIAKLLRPEFSMRTVGDTRTDLQPMTPEFASPEQIRGLPITTASDVYSLGVLLYRLIVSRHPYGLKTNSLLDLERAICESDPEKPSAVIRAKRLEEPGAASARDDGVSDDLDVIVLMAMRKEPQRRYASAEHLSEDVRRLLEGRPVMARKDTWIYRFSKLVSRHKPGAAVAAAASLALLITGLFAYREYLQAQRRTHELRQFTQVVLNMDDALRSGITATRARLLAKAVESLDNLARDAKGDQALQRDLLRGYLNMADVLGNVTTDNIGQAADAEAIYRKALALAEELRHADPKNPAASRDVAVCGMKIGDILLGKGDLPHAMDKYREAETASAALVARDASSVEALADLIKVRTRIATAQERLGDPAAAAETYRSCLESVQRWAAIDPSKRALGAFVRERIAYFLALSGEPAGAEEAIREALNTYFEASGANPNANARRNIAKAYKLKAEIEKRIGKVPEGLASVHKSLEISENLLEADAKNKTYQVDFHQALKLLIDLALLDGKTDEAHRQTQRVLHFLQPRVEAQDASEYPLFDCAWILTYTPFADQQNPIMALDCAKRAAVLTHNSNPEYLEVLAAAYVRNGESAKAVQTLEKALALLPTPRPGRPVPELRRSLEGTLVKLRQ